jgi:hypothetical protein
MKCSGIGRYSDWHLDGMRNWKACKLGENEWRVFWAYCLMWELLHRTFCRPLCRAEPLYFLFINNLRPTSGNTCYLPWLNDWQCCLKFLTALSLFVWFLGLGHSRYKSVEFKLYIANLDWPESHWWWRRCGQQNDVDNGYIAGAKKWWYGRVEG